MNQTFEITFDDPTRPNSDNDDTFDAIGYDVFNAIEQLAHCLDSNHHYEIAKQCGIMGPPSGLVAVWARQKGEKNFKKYVISAESKIEYIAKLCKE